MHRRALLAAGGSLLAGGLAATLFRGRWDAERPERTDWPTAGHDAGNTGATRGAGPSVGASIEWAFDTGGPTLFGSPSVADGTVYTGSAAGESGAVFALDAETGSERWRRTLGTYVYGAPAVTDESVFVAPWIFTSDERHGLHALDRTDGSTRWRALEDAHVEAAVTVHDGVVYVPVSGGDLDTRFAYEDDAVVAVDARDGTVLWHAPAPDAVDAAPAVTDEGVYAAASDGTLLALDRETGERRWTVETDAGSLAAAPAVADGTVYALSVPSRGDWNHLFALDAATGRERWRTGLSGLNPRASPAVVDGTVYANTGVLHSLTARTGEPRWTRPVAADTRSDPALAGGVLYVGGLRGLLAVRHDGLPLWYVHLGSNVRSSPAVAGGRCYVGDRDGVCYCIT